MATHLERGACAPQPRRLRSFRAGRAFATAGTVQFSAATYSVNEGTALAPIRIIRTGGAASGVTVHFQTGTGTAAAGDDYTAIATNLTFAAGEMMKIVRIPSSRRDRGIRRSSSERSYLACGRTM